VSGYRRRGLVHRPPTPEQTVERHRRATWSLPAFATIAIFAFLVVSTVPPRESPALALATDAVDQPGQQYLLADAAGPSAARDGYSITRIPTAPTPRTAPAVGVPDPGTAQAIAYDMVLARGWDQAQFDCLVALWNKESHWNVYAHNARSGAYGIPQALPGDKMASAGSDWQTNPATQITWGLGYISGRYGTPCDAWNHSQVKGWY
jgi:hypothetical protein